AVSPGINANIVFPFPKGYIYPGITVRYRIGSDAVYDYRGVDYGLQAGVVIRLIKSLSANAETGFRAGGISIIDAAGVKRGSAGNIIIPIAAGLRWTL